MLWNVRAPEQGPGRPLATALPELTDSGFHEGRQLDQARQAPAHSQSGMAGCGPEAKGVLAKRVGSVLLILRKPQARSAEPSGKQGVSGELGVGHSDKRGAAFSGWKITKNNIPH